MEKIFNFKSLLLLSLISLNVILFAKLHFLVPLLTGSDHLIDFDDYYHLTGDLLKGVNPYGVSYMVTWGAPLVFIYYLPFSLLNLETARFVTSALNIFSGVIVSLILSNKLFPQNKSVSFLILNFLLFSSFPARFSLEMGQPNLILAFIVTLLIFPTTGKNLKSFLLASLAAFKTYFLLTFLSFLKLEKGIFIRASIFLFIIFLILLPFLDLNINLYFLKVTLPNLLSGGNKIAGLDYYNQSLGSTLARMGIETGTKYLYLFLLFLGSIFIYSAGDIEIAVILSIILSIISWQHYYVVLFPIYIKTFAKNPKKLITFAFLVFIFFFWWSEFPKLHSAKPNLFTGILASHYFLSALFLTGFLYNLKRGKGVLTFTKSN